MKYLIIPFVLLILSAGSLTAKTIKMIFLGDSLTAGYGINTEDAFPALVQDELIKEGMDIEVVNSGVSGSTSASGPGRMQWLLRAEPDWVLICLGANDGLRGQSVEGMKKNLRKTIDLALENGVRVILAGMMMPPNYGQEYTENFRQSFYELADEYKLPFIPFLLEGVAGRPELNLPDGIHPNEKGHKIISELVLKHLRTII